jgi:hypothetical protein
MLLAQGHAPLLSCEKPVLVTAFARRIMSLTNIAEGVIVGLIIAGIVGGVGLASYLGSLPFRPLDASNPGSRKNLAPEVLVARLAGLEPATF